MQQGRKTLIMLTGFVLLAGLALLTEGPWFSWNRQDRQSPVIFSGEGSDTVSRIEISGQQSKVILKKEKESWMVGENDRFYLADAGSVDRVLENLADLNKGTAVSKNPSKHSQYLVDDANGVVVTVFSGSDKTADFIIGGQGPDFFSNYLRQKGENEVLLVKGYVKPLFDKPLKRWRDFTLMSFESEAAVEIEAVQPAGSVLLEKKGKDWKIVAPEEADADPEAVDMLISRLSLLKASDAVEGKEPDDAFHNPILRLTATLKDGTRQEVVFGGLLEAENQHYARSERGATAYLIGAHIIGDLLKALEGLGSREES